MKSKNRKTTIEVVQDKVYLLNGTILVTDKSRILYSIDSPTGRKISAKEMYKIVHEDTLMREELRKNKKLSLFQRFINLFHSVDYRWPKRSPYLFNNIKSK